MKRAMGAARGNSPARSLFSVDCPNRHLNAHSLANIPYIVSPYIGSGTTIIEVAHFKELMTLIDCPLHASYSIAEASLFDDGQ